MKLSELVRHFGSDDPELAVQEGYVIRPVYAFRDHLDDDDNQYVVLSPSLHEEVR